MNQNIGDISDTGDCRRFLPFLLLPVGEKERDSFLMAGVKSARAETPALSPVLTLPTSPIAPAKYRQQESASYVL